MIESNDAIKMVETIASNLISITNNEQNFAKLPDTFWGYFARGHDNKNRKFGVIITFSEKEPDVDELLNMYEQWAEKKKRKL
jgi:protoporphyrinogen oxidase